MISLASVYHLFIEVNATISKQLSIRFVDGLLLMDLRNKHLINAIIISAHGAEMRQ
jgi:hypothetical protein